MTNRNSISIISNNQTMSSLEIAKLTGKRHTHVIRDIREMCESIKDDPDLVHDLNNGVIEIQDKRGYTAEFLLNRFFAELLATGYDALRRAKVIKRLIELEQKEFSNAVFNVTRQESKTEYKAMGFAIAEAHEEIKPYHFSNESDLINRIILGMTASKFRQHHDIPKSDAIRDYLSTAQLNCIIALQRANTVYIEDGLDFQERKDKLNLLFNRKYKHKIIDEIHRLNA